MDPRDAASVDLDRRRRCGFPEVVFGQGKTVDQLRHIFVKLIEHGEPVLAQMTRVFARLGGSVLAVQEVPLEHVKRYGIVAGEMKSDRRFLIHEMVEKPKINPPSRYAIIGRYILPPEIFPVLTKTERGAGGEIQLTDALRELVRSGEFYGYVFEGRRYDAGEKLGYLKATVDYALRHPQLGGEFRTYLQSIFGSK